MMVEVQPMGSGPSLRRRRVGQRGEELAAAYLASHGYEVIARNWRTRGGELDIVARDGEWLVFVEVRARLVPQSWAEGEGQAETLPMGLPEESVTPRKQRRLAAMAEAYLGERPWDGPWRIDVVAVQIRPDGSVARLNHLQDAVTGSA